ncbi:MAG: hypothetical protein ACREUE_12555, partial [Panacagrimonas sp.]
MREAGGEEQRIPLITLPNWVKAAAVCGLSIAEVLDEVGIEADLLHAPSVTGSQIEHLMSACVE